MDEKINIINFKDRRLLLTERNVLVFKSRHKGKLRLSGLGATDGPTLGNSRVIEKDILLELRRLFFKINSAVDIILLSALYILRVLVVTK